MFNKLLYGIRLNGLKKVLKNREREKKFISSAAVGTCLIFRTSNSQAEFLKTKLKYMHPDLRIEQIWLTNGKETFGGAFDTLVSENDLTLSGRFKKSNIEDCLNKQYDWLLDFSEDNNELSALILQYSAAKCKIAWRERKGYQPDLLLDGIESREMYVEKLDEYLNLLSK